MSSLIDVLIFLDRRSVIDRIFFAEGFSDVSIREKMQEWQGSELTKSLAQTGTFHKTCCAGINSGFILCCFPCPT